MTLHVLITIIYHVGTLDAINLFTKVNTHQHGQIDIGYQFRPHDGIDLIVMIVWGQYHTGHGLRHVVGGNVVGGVRMGGGVP